MGVLESPHDLKRPSGFQIPVISLTDTTNSNSTDDKKLHEIEQEANNNNVEKTSNTSNEQLIKVFGTTKDPSLSDENHSDIEKVKTLCSKDTTSGASLSERIQNLSICIRWIKTELVRGP